MTRTDHFQTNRAETKLPENLVAELAILPNPVQYSMFKKRLEKCGAIDQEADVLSYLKQIGTRVLNIPEPQEALPEITPDENGVLRDVKQIKRYLQEERRGENQILDLATEVILVHGNSDIFGWQLANKHIRDRYFGEIRTGIDPMKTFLIFALPAEKRDMVEKLMQPVRDQLDFLLQNFKSENELRTPKERIDSELQANQEKINTALREQEEREEKQQAREQDPVEAKKFLIGLARGALERNNNSVAKSVTEVLQNKNAARYIKIHSISITQLIQEREETRERNRRDRGMHTLLPFAVLLLAFEKPRTVTQKASPAEFIIDSLKLWLDARFTAELPAETYDYAVDKQEAYHSKRTRDRDRRDFDLPEDFDWDVARQDPELAPLIQRFEKSSSSPVTNEFDLCRNNPEVAIVWWNLPEFKRWEYLRNGVRDLMREKRVRAGDVYGILQAQIRELEEKKKRANIVLKANSAEVTEDGRSVAAINYWEYIMNAEPGKLDSEHLQKLRSTRDQGEVFQNGFSNIQSEIKSLQAFTEAFHFNFIISREERDRIIAERKEAAAIRRASFGFGNRAKALFGDGFF